MDEWDPEEEIRLALAGNGPACTRLVRRLTPVIQSRVARALLRWRTGSAAGRNVRQEVEDLTQDIFLYLFEDDGKVLGSWRPERGLSFLNFIGFVAYKQAISILRNGKTSPWKDEPTPSDELDAVVLESNPEEIIASREQLELLLDHLVEELSPLGWHLFDLLFLRELSVEEVVRETKMSRAAVDQWKSRLRRLARRLLDEISKWP